MNEHLYAIDLTDAIWTKSQASQDAGSNCVEVAKLIDGDGVIVGRATRNSKRPEAVTRFNNEEWAAFLDGVRKGEDGLL